MYTHFINDKELAVFVALFHLKPGTQQQVNQGFIRSSINSLLLNRHLLQYMGISIMEYVSPRL